MWDNFARLTALLAKVRVWFNNVTIYLDFSAIFSQIAPSKPLNQGRHWGRLFAAEGRHFDEASNVTPLASSGFVFRKVFDTCLCRFLAMIFHFEKPPERLRNIELTKYLIPHESRLNLHRHLRVPNSRYLRRHIYGELKPGDRNNARAVKW